MTKDQLNAIVDGWFGEKIATGFIARNTDAYNQVFLACDDLKARLAPAAGPEALLKTKLPAVKPADGE